MISVDSNLLLFAQVVQSPFHSEARDFLTELDRQPDVVVSELVLVELYCLLRNPAVIDKPLVAAAAVKVIESYRQHPRWQIAGFTDDSRRLHDELWVIAAKDRFAFRRIYDARLALALRTQGVTDFATANVKDFEGFGFQRVWNPLGK